MSAEAPSGAGRNGRTATEIVPLVGMEEVARWLGTTTRHVQRLVTEKRLPYVKVGHFIRFDSRDVLQWIETQKVDIERGRMPLAVTIDTERQVAPPATLTRCPTSAADVLARWQTESR